MKISREEALQYAIHHRVTASNVLSLALVLPSEAVLELCLELIDHGFNIDDIVTMIHNRTKTR